MRQRWSPRSRGSASPRPPEARRRIVPINPFQGGALATYGPERTSVYDSRSTCGECSVGTKEDPIPSTNKRKGEFRIYIAKNLSVDLCRGCALQFAEDFASELETLTE